MSGTADIGSGTASTSAVTYSWRCQNCGTTKSTSSSASPGGQCSREKGGGNHNWVNTGRSVKP